MTQDHRDHIAEQVEDLEFDRDQYREHMHAGGSVDYVSGWDAAVQRVARDIRSEQIHTGPRRITTLVEFDALPVGSVVVDDCADVNPTGPLVSIRDTDGQWNQSGSLVSRSSEDIFGYACGTLFLVYSPAPEGA